jgi:hypothetical protein
MRQFDELNSSLPMADGYVTGHQFLVCGDEVFWLLRGVGRCRLFSSEAPPDWGGVWAVICGVTGWFVGGEPSGGK